MRCQLGDAQKSQPTLFYMRNAREGEIMNLMSFTGMDRGYTTALKKIKLRGNKFIKFRRYDRELLMYFLNNHPIEYAVCSYEGVKIPALWGKTRKIYMGIQFGLNRWGFEVHGVNIKTPNEKGKLVDFSHYNGTGWVCLNGENERFMQTAFNETSSLYPFKERNLLSVLKTIKTKEAHAWMSQFVGRMETAVMAMITKVHEDGIMHNTPRHCPPTAELYNYIKRRRKFNDRWTVPAKKMTIEKRGK